MNSKKQPKMIYLDNNATTQMSVDARKSMIEWCNRGNPSAGYASAKEARKMMTEFREYLGKLCGVDPCCPEERDGGASSKRKDPSKYKIIFTSGASEANCMALQGVVEAYAENTGKQPHIVLSAIEHKSLIEMAQSYELRHKASLTLVSPTYSGHIRPEDVIAAVQPNTCIICVMSANNETGAINDIAAIGASAHKYNIPYHCDTVQSFGKNPPDLIGSHIDSCCVSFHKFGGPPGVGALIIKQQLLLGYKIAPMIFGTQNEGLRGGTENLPGIGASFAACKIAMTSRDIKNRAMFALKKYIIEEIGRRIPSYTYTTYIERKKLKVKNAAEIVFLSAATDYYLCNTILLSVVKRGGASVCNSEMKTQLEKRGIVISVGSACNTSSAKASHVLYAMGADELIRKGALRITLGDLNTKEEAEKFVQEFLIVVKEQLAKK